MLKYGISMEMSVIIAIYLALQKMAETSLFCKIRNSIIRNNKMSKTDSLHYRLCCEGAKWMRKQEWGTYHTVAVELCTVNVENPDVWGTTGFKSMLIEVKTSRASFYAFYTGKKWGHSTSYDLCISSSILGLDKTTDFIADFVCKALEINE